MIACWTCSYYLRGPDKREDDLAQESEGLCRRYPPCIVDAKLEPKFPKVTGMMWCGEWKYQEEGL